MLIGIILALLCYSSSLRADEAVFFTVTQNDITLTAHLMQPAECKEFFLHNLITYQVYPIQLVITNNTQKRWLLSGNSIEEFALIQPALITKDIIFKHVLMADITAYVCALAGWLGAIAGFHMVQDYLPTITHSIQYLSSAATLMSLMYQAYRFTEHQSKLYKRTQTHIMLYGLSSTNLVIEPQNTITKVMFLNDKSYRNSLTVKDTFFYLFTVILFNEYDCDDSVTFIVEVPKVF